MKRLITVLLVAMVGTSFAQQDLTLYNMRYLQQASFTNPAFFSECKATVGMPGFSSAAFRFGNSGFVPRNFLDVSSFSFTPANALDKMKDVNYLDEEFRYDPIHFGFSTKGKNYFGLNVSVRQDFRLTYPRDLFTLLFYGNGMTDDEAQAQNISTDYALLGKRANLDEAGLDFQLYSEIGFQYAHKFLEEENLTIGIRPKLLLGGANIYTRSSAFGLSTNDTNYALTFDGDMEVNTSMPFENFLDSFELGQAADPSLYFNNMGFGIDLGMTYDITEKIQVSASATDIGFINWKTNPKSYLYDQSVVKFVGVVGIEDELLGSNTAQQGQDTAGGIVDTLVSSITDGFIPSENTEAYRQWLTARFNVGANYQLAEKHNVGLLLNAHTFKKKFRAAMTVSWNYRVRKWFGFSVNYSMYNRSFANVGVGTSFNFFPLQFYFISDNVLGSFIPASTKNVHFRTGLNWTFGCKNDKDKDGIPDKQDDCPTDPGPAEYNGCPDTDKDGIIDRDDKCPETPGPKEFEGCPDRDGDGIIDNEDECPDAPGVVEFNGCPDTDEDGIKDSEDECPTVAGIPEFNGCPDTDKDGIRDSEDDCPETPGIPEFKGCPDTDLDGIMDSEDACPEKAGPEEFQGCPDTDGDGLPDNKDGCPEKAGPIDNNGCPFGDRDGDGVIDKEDSCPDTPGPVENAGCPYSDLDGDGVLDKDDRCPQTPGPVDNEGCPVIEEEEQEVLNTAFDALEFETGKDIIKATSYASLNELAELMVKKEGWKLQISGHTDSQGSDAANMSLSEKRAKAVGTYLESRGVKTDQLIVQWFGETQPIADNATAEGRAKNRRVEMEVKFD